MNRNLNGTCVGLVCLLSVFCLSGLAQERTTQGDQPGKQRGQQVVADPDAPNRAVQAPSETVPQLVVPRLVKFSGIAKDEIGKPRTGTVGITLAIYKEPVEGAPLWLETQNVELDEQGRYTVLLGATKNEGLPMGLFASGEPRWLGVQVQLPGETEQPRVLLVSVPYALKAADAETLGGMPASAFALAAPSTSTQTSATSKTAGKTTAGGTAKTSAVTTIGGGGTPNVVTKFDGTGANVINSSISDNGNRINAAEGIDFGSDFSFVGNAEPAATGRVQMFDRAFVGFVIRGLNVLFETLQGSPAAPKEVMRVTQAGNVGIGTSSPVAKLDVAGTGNFSGNTTIPLLTVTQSGTTGNPVGLFVTANGAAVDGIGIVGVRGTANLPGGFGIVGSAGPAGSIAGQFNGNVNVTGNINIGGNATVTGAKMFAIDHPLDPANKYLYHAAVESPKMKNMYDGVAMLDANGEAVVRMPKWFQALNCEFRYQLTAIGAPGPNLYIAEEIAHNRFRIAGGKPGMKVSWQITGVRQDAWAKSHRMAVEQEKPTQERGTYLHPEVFGQPEEKGVASTRHPELMRQIEESSKPAAAKQP